MSTDAIWINYRELSRSSIQGQEWPSLRDHISAEAQDHEDEVARYLETAPSYSGVGTIVGDVLDPSAQVVLFPGKKTDGVYVWPAELFYYVRKYHLKIPSGFITRMMELNWQPPTEQEIDWERLGMPDM